MRRLLLLAIFATLAVLSFSAGASATVPAGYQEVKPWTVGNPTSTAPVPAPFGGTASLTAGPGLVTNPAPPGAPRVLPTAAEITSNSHCLDGHSGVPPQNNTATCDTYTVTLTFSQPVTDPVVPIRTGGGGWSNGANCTADYLDVTVAAVNGAAPTGVTADSVSSGSTFTNNTLAISPSHVAATPCTANGTTSSADLHFIGTVTSVTFTYTLKAVTTKYTSGGLSISSVAGVVTDVFVPPPVSDLAVTKTGPAVVAPGGTITWTITVTNNGPDAEPQWTLTDAIPTGVTNASTSTSGCSVASGTLTCNGTNLAVGASKTITLTGTAPNTPGTVTNTANVSGTNTDPTMSNNQASASATVDPSVGTPMFDGPVLVGVLAVAGIGGLIVRRRRFAS